MSARDDEWQMYPEGGATTGKTLLHEKTMRSFGQVSLLVGSLLLWDFSLLGEKSQASMHFDRIIPCSDYITPFLCCDLIWSMMIQQTSSWIPYTQFRWGMQCYTFVICLWDSYLVACRSHRKNLVSTDTYYALKKQSSLSCILAQNM